MAKIATFQNPIFQDETKAREALEAVLWPEVLSAPIAATAIPTKLPRCRASPLAPACYYCNECKREFTVTVGTVFERSKVPLTKWWMAAHMLNSGKNGVSRSRNSPDHRRHLQNRMVHDAPLA